MIGSRVYEGETISSDEEVSVDSDFGHLEGKGLVKQGVEEKQRHESSSELGWYETHEDSIDRNEKEERSYQGLIDSTSEEFENSWDSSESQEETSDISIDGLMYFDEIDRQGTEDTMTYHDHMPEQEFLRDCEISTSSDDEDLGFSKIYSRMGQRRNRSSPNDEYDRSHDDEFYLQEDDGRGVIQDRSSSRGFGRWEPWHEVSAEDLTEIGWSRRLKEQQGTLKVDLQGIPWSELPTNRDQMRTSRLNSYKNYENLAMNRDVPQKEIIEVDDRHDYYRFKYSTMNEKCSIVHFQLRNLIWATDTQKVYYTAPGGIRSWSSISRKSSMAMDTKGIQVSTIVVKDNIVAAGGFLGELICKYIDSPGYLHEARISNDENGITNAVDIIETRNGVRAISCVNNDKAVRIYDLTTFQLLKKFQFPWAVNYAQLSPDKRLMCIVGDDTISLIINVESGEVIHELKGHLDYSFSCAWSPDGRSLATGNQDRTTRLYDIRHTAKSFGVLCGKMGAIRSLRYTSDGRFLAMAEPADFVHIFDRDSGYHRSQLIDFFGEISGMSFTPNEDYLYIGNADRALGGLLEFEKIDQGICDMYL